MNRFDPKVGHEPVVLPDGEGISDDIRPLRPALLRGWRRRCPCCGQGPMMKSYLKVRSDCPVCHEPLHHHRADDGPAYLTILIVGHIMAPAIIWAFTPRSGPTRWFWPPPLPLAVWRCRFTFAAQIEGRDRGVPVGQEDARVWQEMMRFP